MAVPNPFPKLDISETSNPAFVLFGCRFFADQTLVELLSELLSVVFSEKWIDSIGPITSPFPSMEELQNWNSRTGVELKYAPPIKLNLKLFSLLCASPLDSRHQVHEDQYRYLVKAFTDKVQTSTKTAEEVKDWVEDFLMGFQGAGFDRRWCAQNFYPVTKSFLVQETLWKESFAANRRLSWSEVRDNLHKFFDTTKHAFLARGGEVLYLQLCNLFANKTRNIAVLARKLGLTGVDYELDNLYGRLVKGLEMLENECFVPLDILVDFIENLDPETRWEQLKHDTLTCKWCPEESWPEAYLFAVETSRVLRAVLDPVQRLELMQVGCGLQVLRSLCAQAVRYAEWPLQKASETILGYSWVFSPTEQFTRQQRLASCYNFQIVSKLIKDALQHVSGEKLPANLDSAYGHRFFRSLGVRLGIVYPKRGAEPRFVLTNKILRYLVLSVIEPGEACEYEEFRHRIYMHYGIAAEGEELQNAIAWTGLPVNSSVQPRGGSWLRVMLRAGGFLVELSDGCSIVRNPYSAQF